MQLPRRSDTAQVDSIAAAIDRDGWFVTAPMLGTPEIDRALFSIAPLVKNGDRRGGIRNLFDHSDAVRDLVQSQCVRSVTESVLGQGCFAVRALLFDKTPNANWKVTWHQDLTIAVAERRDAPDYGPWSEKELVPHVQPPVEVLEQMLAIRIHLDDCGADNGPLRVLSGSHRAGRLSADEIERWRATVPETQCLASCGAIMVMRPLLLHASSAAAVRPDGGSAHRRVLHFEFAAASLTTLSHGLRWRWRV